MTGLPLGILEDETWTQRTLQFPPDSSLFLYTDGVTDAENRQGEFFSKERLLKVLGSCRGSTAQDLLGVLMDAVHDFTADAPGANHDDVTVMVLVRESAR